MSLSADKTQHLSQCLYPIVMFSYAVFIHNFSYCSKLAFLEPVRGRGSIGLPWVECKSLPHAGFNFSTWFFGTDSLIT